MMVDTLTIARELKAADLPAGQAEAIAAAIGRSVSEGSATKADLENVHVALGSDVENVRIALKSEVENVRVALKSDIENVRVALKSDIENVRHELRTEIEKDRNQVLIWVVSTQIAVGGMIIALLKL